MRKGLVLSIVVLFVLAIFFFYFEKSKTAEHNSKIINKNSMQILSPVFEDNTKIPSKYTCDGSQVVPPLEFAAVPKDAKSLVLFLEDPDTTMGTFDHWVKWNIPVTTTRIDEGKEPEGISGKGTTGDLNYIGPCPPTGEHRYIFSLYALDTTLDIPEGSDKETVKASIEGHIIDEATLTGLYSKESQK